MRATYYTPLLHPLTIPLTSPLATSQISCELLTTSPHYIYIYIYTYTPRLRLHLLTTSAPHQV